MVKGKGWINYDRFQSKRHGLSALGIKTGRKVLPKKPISMLVGDQTMFYPKKDNKPKRSFIEKLIAPPEGKREAVFEIYNKEGEKIQTTYSWVGNKKELMMARKRVEDQFYTPNPALRKRIFLNKKKSEDLNFSNPIDYGDKDNRGKKIVKGAVIGATVGALTYKGKRQTYFAYNKEGLKGITIGATSQKQALEFAKDIHGKGAKIELWKKPVIKGGKIMKKDLNYNGTTPEDVTIEPTTVSGVTTVPEKTGFLKKVGRGAVAFGKGAKATFEKGQEIAGKLRKMQEEAEVKKLEKSQKELLQAQSQLQIVRTRKKIEATKKAVESERESILPKLF